MNLTAVKPSPRSLKKHREPVSPKYLWIGLEEEIFLLRSSKTCRTRIFYSGESSALPLCAIGEPVFIICPWGVGSIDSAEFERALVLPEYLLPPFPWALIIHH